MNNDTIYYVEAQIKKSLEAFCKVCGYKKCSERDVHCTEYKEFERLIKE